MRYIAVIAGIALLIVGLVFISGQGRASLEQCVTATVFVGVGTSGSGSGVWVGPHDILTARHVADTDEPLWVIDAQGIRSNVVHVLLDRDDDMALLTVEGIAPIWLSIGNSPSLGDSVYIIGAPLGIKNYPTITAGVLSRTKDFLDDYWAGVCVVDALAAPGNSGGPVIHNGQLVGLCVGIFRGWPMSFYEPISDLDQSILDIIHVHRRELLWVN